MGFTDAIKTCFNKYADFNGRAKRPEYWWYWLFVLLVSLAISVLSRSASGLFSLVTFIPSLAVGARRLHDTDRSGWWQLLWIIPVIGWIVMIVFLVSEGSAGDNRFGSPPAS
ncbi:MAG TPA: DUF805 domain-containing protein [Steroidobacteraceae bacterium]|nr:DUF805 domain-containing protein [Steroidobacteraceae bacterium]